MPEPVTSRVLEVSAITHDLAKRRSLVLLTWPNDPERRLSLPVPFETTPADAVREAGVALRELVREIESAEIALAGR